MKERTTKILTEETSVLIVDDNPQFSSILKMILGQGFGFKQITTVDSTEAAYSLINQAPEKFQLLFVDFRFPGGETGGDLLEKLKQQALLDDKVAFLITSEPTIDNQKQALKAGAMGVVAKPFDRNALRMQLEKADRALKADAGESF